LACDPADATAIPKPHNLLPHFNPDWFYLSGTGLPTSSGKKAVKRVGACVAVGLNVERIGAETATNVRGHHVIEQLVDPGLFQRQLVSSLFDH